MSLPTPLIRPRRGRTSPAMRALSRETRLHPAQLVEPMFVAEVFSGIPGRYVKLADTIASFKAILNGEADDLPEDAFYMVGDLEDARRKAKELEAK